MKGKSILCMLLVVAMVLSGCSGGTNSSPSSSSNEATKRDSLIYALIGEPQGLDPHYTNETMAYTVIDQVFDRLVRYHEDGTVTPELAEKWDISEDGKTITFTIKQGVKFHNGDEMTAEDVVYSLNRSMQSNFTPTTTSSMDSAEVVDKYVVNLNLKHPYDPIFACLSDPQLSIINKKLMEADEESIVRNPVGTGPYMFKEWKNGEKIVCERFDDYFKGQPSIKDLTFRIITDSNTAVIALEKGEVDVLSDPPLADRQSLIDNKDISYSETEKGGYVFIMFNNEKGMFADKTLRQAISYAVDKEAFIAGAVEGIGTPVETPFTRYCFGWPEDFKNNPYDPEKAKELLAEAGYPDGFKVTLKTQEAPLYLKPTQILQEQLRVIGIDAEIEVMERGAYISTVWGGDFDYEISVTAGGFPIPDADWMWAHYHSSMKESGKNYLRVDIPKLDELLDEGKICQDKEKRKEIYRDVCQVIKDEAVMVPLYTYMLGIATNKDLKGVQADPKGLYYIYEFSW